MTVLVLASASPRRAELLAAAGLAFDIAPAHIDEGHRPGELPEAYVARLAEDKAVAVRRQHPDAVVLGADTIVLVDDVALGKPADRQDAERMLRLLSGRTHQVLTAVCLKGEGNSASHVEWTTVRLATLGDDDIAWYVASGEPMGKAGAYAIQGLASRFVEEIQGSYTNVVGLPMAAVCRLLRTLGCGILNPEKGPL